MLGRIYSQLRAALQSPTRSLSVTRRTSAVKRTRSFRLGMETLEDRTVPTVFYGTVFNPASGLTLTASADFTQVGSDLHIYLQNTTSSGALVPSDALTAIFFDVAGSPSLTRGDATLHSGSVVMNAPATAVDNTPLSGGTVAGSGEVGGEYGFVHNGSGLATGVAQTYGVSSSGFGIFGPGNLLNIDNAVQAINLQGPNDPDGVQYGIVNGIGAGHNAPLDTNALISNGVDIVLHGYNGEAISNISFQFGTGLDEPHTDRGSGGNGSITGFKFNDHTGDGVRQDGDEGVNGVTIVLDNDTDAGNGNLATFVTTSFLGQDGFYHFDGLVDGTYYVYEQVPAGSTPTEGSAGYQVVITGGTISSTTDLNTDGLVNASDFGNFKNIIISGYKFYDANTNGTFDGNPTEGKIPNWTINLYNDVNNNGELDGGDTLAQTTTTNGAGNYSFTVTYAGQFLIMESTTPPAGFTQTGWVPTTDVVQSTDALFSGDTGSAVFGNVELGKGGGLTLGFWSNKNGKAAMGITAGGMNATLAFLSGLNLKTATGGNFDPTTYDQFRTWILGATATNMSYMLSAQLATMELNVRQGFVNGGALIYAPGTTSANANGFATVNDVMSEANTELGVHGTAMSADSWRAYQEKLKNALDNANNNLSFVLAWHDDNHNGVVDPGEIG